MVCVKRSVSELYRVCISVIMTMTAEGQSSLTVTVLELSVMQIYTRIRTVKAAAELVCLRWLTSWHRCWMHKGFQIHTAAMNRRVMNLTFKAWIIANDCINARKHFQDKCVTTKFVHPKMWIYSFTHQWIAKRFIKRYFQSSEAVQSTAFVP